MVDQYSRSAMNTDEEKQLRGEPHVTRVDLSVLELTSFCSSQHGGVQTNTLRILHLEQVYFEERLGFQELQRPRLEVSAKVPCKSSRALCGPPHRAGG